MPANASVAYRILAVARGEGGRQDAAFEASGLAHRSASGDLQLLGDKVTAIHQGDAAVRFRVSADAQAGTLRLEAQGAENSTMRWVARIDLSEVRF
jgi:hypothetical protein